MVKIAGPQAARKLAEGFTWDQHCQERTYDGSEIAGVSVHLLADGRRALVHVEMIDDAVAREIADALTTARCVASLRPSTVKRPKPPRKPQ